MQYFCPRSTYHSARRYLSPRNIFFRKHRADPNRKQRRVCVINHEGSKSLIRSEILFVSQKNCYQHLVTKEQLYDVVNILKKIFDIFFLNLKILRSITLLTAFVSTHNYFFSLAYRFAGIKKYFRKVSFVTFFLSYFNQRISTAPIYLYLNRYTSKKKPCFQLLFSRDIAYDIDFLLLSQGKIFHLASCQKPLTLDLS